MLRGRAEDAVVQLGVAAVSDHQQIGVCGPGGDEYLAGWMPDAQLGRDLYTVLPRVVRGRADPVFGVLHGAGAGRGGARSAAVRVVVAGLARQVDAPRPSRRGWGERGHVLRQLVDRDDGQLRLRQHAGQSDGAGQRGPGARRVVVRHRDPGEAASTRRRAHGAGLRTARLMAAGFTMAELSGARLTASRAGTARFSRPRLTAPGAPGRAWPTRCAHSPGPAVAGPGR